MQTRGIGAMDGANSSVWRGFLEAALRSLWPGRCAACGAVDVGDCFCAACTAELRFAAAGSAPDAVDSVYAHWAYDGPVRAAIRQWKFGSREAIGRVFAKVSQAQLAPRIGADWPLLCADGSRPAAIVPIPSHPTRLRERGFEPSWVLARGLWRALRRVDLTGDELVFDDAGLCRSRATAHQSSLGRAERGRNVAGAFATRGRSAPLVILVDDVLTTGATASEAARTLRAAGARQVVLATLARAPFDDALPSA